MILCHNLIVILSVSSLLCVQAQSGIRDHYRFNHPPSIETFESVAAPSPVAAVNNRGEAREEKSFELSATSEEESNPINNNDEALPDYIKNTSSETKTEKVENSNKNLNFSNRKSSIRQNLEIPVSVVYDAKSEVVYSNKRNDQSRNRSSKKRKQIARRLQKSKSDESVRDVVSNDDDDKLLKEKSIGNTDNNESLKSLSIQNIPVIAPSPLSTEERKRLRTRPPVVPIVNEMNFVYAHSGNFHYSFEGGDGTKVFEEGSLKTINEDTGEAVHGGFSYTDKEGNDFSLSYTADENGYRPIGAHLPTPPPIPPAIARALAYLATKTVPQPTEATEFA